MIQFVGKRMTWCFDWSCLNFVVLRPNPDCRDPKVDPPDELACFFLAARVTLLGWRLNLILDDIACHRITHVWRLSGEPASQTREVVWISEIFVAPDDQDIFQDYSPTDPPAGPETSQLN